MRRHAEHNPPMASRPKCHGCGKRLRPVSFMEYERIERPKTDAEKIEERKSLGNRHSPISDTWISQKELGRKFFRWEGYDGFHSLRCALHFAVAAHAAGYRLKRTGGA